MRFSPFKYRQLKMILMLMACKNDQLLSRGHCRKFSAIIVKYQQMPVKLYSKTAVIKISYPNHIFSFLLFFSHWKLYQNHCSENQCTAKQFSPAQCLS